MFEKIKSLFSRAKAKPLPEEIPQEDGRDIREQIGEKVYPILRIALQTGAPPDGISKSEWSRVKEGILWSFSALRAEKKPMNNIKKREQAAKIQNGLILFAKHIDNFKL